MSVTNGTEESKDVADILKDNIIAVFLLIVGISLSFVADQLGIVGIIVCWLIIIIVILAFYLIKFRDKLTKLESSEGSKRRIDELFLKQLMDPKVIMGQDLIIPPLKSRGFYTHFNQNDRIEFLAFSEKKFSLIFFDKANYEKMESALNSSSGQMIDLSQLGVVAEFAYDNVTFVKNRVRIKKTDNWIFFVKGEDNKEVEDMTVNLLVSFV